MQKATMLLGPPIKSLSVPWSHAKGFLDISNGIRIYAIYIFINLFYN